MKLSNLTRLAIAVLAICAPLVEAAPPYVTVNGKVIDFPDMQPRFMNNHVMVPLRGVFERLNASVDWNSGLQQITCVKDDSTVQLYLGSNEARVNGDKILFDAPATLSHGRTLVPLRFLSQALGAKVEWDDASQTVQVFTPKFARHRDRTLP